MAKDYSKLAKGKLEDDLTKRMDEDKDMLYLKKYVMMDAGEKNAIPDIVNVTLNRPALYAANVESALGKTTEQRVVESAVKDFDTAYVEAFLDAAFDAANERLIKRGEPTLNAHSDEQFCIRGRAAKRILFRMKDEVLIPDIANWDTRYFTYEMGVDGLSSASYNTTRDKDVLEAEYEEELRRYNVSITGKGAPVLDVWHTEANEVWVSGKKILEQENPFGFVPVVFRVVSLGSMLADIDSLAHQGESIFFLIRGVIPELNRLISIMQTLNLKAVKPPIKQKIKGKKAAKHEDLTAMGAVTAMEPTDDIARIDYGDAQRSAQMAYGMLDKANQEGSLSAFDLGTFTQPMSAIALIEIGEGRDQVFAPRLGARGMMNQQIADMIIEQVIQIGGSVELGTKGHKRTFQTSKLKGEYETHYQYFVKSPKIDAGLYTLAAAAGDLIPERAKRREILQREDPDGDERQLSWEEAARLSPAVKMNRIIKDLVEMDEDFDAELLSAEMGVSLKQMLAGDINQLPKPEKEQKPKQVAPMFGQGGGMGRAVRPESTPTEEEGV